jgi:Delta7-sterol 5-desaturase
MHDLALILAMAVGAWGLLASAAGAARPADREVSPDGLWLTVDDRTGKPRSEVRISVDDGRLLGTVERIHPREGDSTDPVCSRCAGPRRGARVVGMVILWGHVARGARWVDGRILDPENGKEYASSVWPDGADRLRVRGRWGPFFRTQTWRRVGASELVQTKEKE